MMVLMGSLFCIALGAAVLVLFVEPRFSAAKVWGACAAVVLVLWMANAVVFHQVSQQAYVRLFPLLNHPPLLLLTFWISRHRGWRLIFQFLSSVLLCFFVQHVGSLVFLAGGQRPWCLALGYALVTPAAVWFFVARLRPLYFEIVEQVGGWPLLCLPLAIYYGAMFLLLTEAVVVSDSFLITAVKPYFTFLMVGVYGVLMALFDLVRRQARERQDGELAALQRDALQARLESVRSAEERIAIERHDLRHRLNTLATLVKAGDGRAALEAIDAANQRLEETRRHRWCAEPTLNATFDYYFQLAQERGVRVESQLAFSETLPAPAAELSVLLANALDNAIKACGQLPKEQRVLSCRAIAYPRLMLEVTNPCARPPVWDREGFPVSLQPGHGTGMRSIRNFCRQYGAFCQCGCKDGRFCLRVAF